jgi:hypothetical protein
VFTRWVAPFQTLLEESVERSQAKPYDNKPPSIFTGWFTNVNMIFHDLVHKQFLEEGVQSCDRLCNEYVASSIGPNGSFKMIQIPGGRLTISASIQKILQAFQKKQQENDKTDFHPIARLVMRSAMAHSKDHVGDSCGIYILFVTNLLITLIRSSSDDFRVQRICRSLDHFSNTTLPHEIIPILIKNVSQISSSNIEKECKIGVRK